MHGAWHGGWCWRKVSDILIGEGHRVVTPTQTGLGERKHLMRADITLDTFVTDVLNVVDMEDLKDLILVGHSFAGSTISGVADRVPERIRKLVYLDALILQPGSSVLATLPPDRAADYRAAFAKANSTIPAPPPSFFGIPAGPDADWVKSHLTPHPSMTYDSPLTLRHPVGSQTRCAYIACVNPALSVLARSHEFAKSQTEWENREINTGHDAMITAPVELAQMLQRLA